MVKALPIVFKERIYKIWKQFTTSCSAFIKRLNCVQRTNIQNLKAIHNYPWFLRSIRSIVFKERIYKIWKQFTTELGDDNQRFQLCSKNEYTKSESNSQQRLICNTKSNIVFKERIYKIWKQFTTTTVTASEYTGLCSKNEYTKSESNSQHVSLYVFRNGIVFKERIYKIWKQFTTEGRHAGDSRWLCSKNEYTKSESNSQRLNPSLLSAFHCVQRTNIQNLKAIHNSFLKCLV